MLNKLYIEGFKCFDEVELSLKNLNLFTGINSSGKSSVIQAILLLLQQKEIIYHPLNGKYVKLGLFQDVKNAVTNPREIVVKAQIEDKVCSISVYMDEILIEESEVLDILDLVYLSAERIGVEDVYKQNLTNEYKIGIQGQYAFDYLSRERMNPLKDKDFCYPGTGMNLGNQVDYWLKYIMGYYVTAEWITGTEVVKVSYRRTENGSKEIKPRHLGTGVSYVTNVIISALSCKKGDLFIIENPEIHLHPSAQAKLTEFFSFLASRGLQIIMETHSDHVFNGVRKSLKAGNIAKEQTAVYFFKMLENGLSEAVQIQIDSEGVLKNHEKGLFDQMDDDLDELLGL